MKLALPFDIQGSSQIATDDTLHTLRDAWRWRDGDVNVCHRAEGRKWAVEFRRLAHHEDGEPILVEILLRHTRNILLRDCLDACPVALQEILGIAIEFVIHARA